MLNKVKGKADLAMKMKKSTLHIGNHLEGTNFDNLPLNVKRASSLQPIGYPLFDMIKPKMSKSKYIKNIKILAPISQSYEYQNKLLQLVFDALDVKVTWDFKTKTEFGEHFLLADQHDLALFDFVWPIPNYQLGSEL